MYYNEVIEAEIVTDLATEPVSLEELKRHLNMLFDTDGAYEFNDDDTYLEMILTAARQEMERYTGLSFGEKTIRAYVRNDKGDVDIPYGPLIAIASVKDERGNTLTVDTQYKTSGSQFRKLVSPVFSHVELNYTAGYEADKLPQALKMAIMHYAAFLYAQRGESKDAEKYSASALELASPYKRTGWLT